MTCPLKKSSGKGVCVDFSPQFLQKRAGADGKRYRDGRSGEEEEASRRLRGGKEGAVTEALPRGLYPPPGELLGGKNGPANTFPGHNKKQKREEAFLATHPRTESSL